MVQEAAKRRARILAFWQKPGPEATQEAFSVSRRTLFLWKTKPKAGGGRLEALNPGSRRPHRVRRRQWPAEITATIRKFRTEHPNLGKEKLHPVLQAVCDRDNLRCPKIRTIGRIIADAPDKMRAYPQKVRHNGTIVARKREPKLRKPKRFIARYPGHCGAFDTIKRFVHGGRRCILTFTDLFSRFSFALATTSRASQAAREFFTLITAVFPHRLDHVLTDNGSEFMRHFAAELRRLHRTHWHTYPKTPRMNAHAERFNRTLQEEFIATGQMTLDTEKFNRALTEWLVEYNFRRPHASLGYVSPINLIYQHSRLLPMTPSDTYY